VPVGSVKCLCRTEYYSSIRQGSRERRRLRIRCDIFSVNVDVHRVRECLVCGTEGVALGHVLNAKLIKRFFKKIDDLWICNRCDLIETPVERLSAQRLRIH
jgi:hypothetical protein